jgi:predicted amidohydrolase
MKISVAQTKPIKGNIQSNIDNHIKLVSLAVSNGADIVVFPELSLTGYEPKLAKELATNQDDSRFDVFQTISDTNQITIGVGVPTKNNTGICISMILFQPQAKRQIYSKQYLHVDEEEFFVSGRNLTDLQIHGTRIAFAICYELSVPEHAEKAYTDGAEIYIASAVVFMHGIEKDLKRLSEIASKYSMPVLLSNSIGQSDDLECAGKSSIWNNKGLLIGQLNNTDEGIIIYDTDTQEHVIDYKQNELAPLRSDL